MHRSHLPLQLYLSTKGYAAASRSVRFAKQWVVTHRHVHWAKNLWIFVLILLILMLVPAVLRLQASLSSYSLRVSSSKKAADAASQITISAAPIIESIVHIERNEAVNVLPQQHQSRPTEEELTATWGIEKLSQVQQSSPNIVSNAGLASDAVIGMGARDLGAILAESDHQNHVTVELLNSDNRRSETANSEQHENEQIFADLSAGDVNKPQHTTRATENGEEGGNDRSNQGIQAGVESQSGTRDADADVDVAAAEAAAASVSDTAESVAPPVLDAALKGLPDVIAIQSTAAYPCQAMGNMRFSLPKVVNITTSPFVSRNRHAETTVSTIQYGEWAVGYPHFIRPEHYDWWKRYQVVNWRKKSPCAQPDDELFFCEREYIQGQVEWINGEVVVSESGPHTHSCGPEATSSLLTENGEVLLASLLPTTPADFLRRVDVQRLFWAVIPATWTYQHYVQNTLPKMSQTLVAHPNLMSMANITANQELLLDRYPIVKEFYDDVHWNAIDERRNPIVTQELIYACQTPPLHPSLWQLFTTKILRVEAKPLEQRKTLFYAGRSRTGKVENDGRRVVNDDQVLDLLRQWKEYEVIEFDHRTYNTIDALREAFADARALIGPHGGALTNVIFMGCNSLVIEMFPLIRGYKPPLPHSGMMMYMQSTFLNHEYWMVPVGTMHGRGNFEAPLIQLCEILVQSLGAPAWIHDIYPGAIDYMTPIMVCEKLIPIDEFTRQ